MAKLKSVIKLEDVSKYYKSADTVSVGMQKVNLEFSMGEFVAITGESGSGKSTLLNVISGLDTYQEGELYLFEEETSHYIVSDWEKYRSAYVGFVFQNYNIIDSYTVLQNVLLALEVQGYDPKKKKERALELIDKVGLSSHIHHKASKLSGGQKQRAVIARALAKDCPIIVADEPTGNLDSKSAETVMKLLHDISAEKLVVVVTHDYDVVEPYATRKIKMHDGQVAEDKKFNKTEPLDIEEPKTKSMRLATIFRFGLRNLTSTPKRTIFLLFMQMIVMLAFTLLYATINSSLLDLSTSNQSNNVNVPETRLLVEKRDGSGLTQTDIDYFESIKEVDAVYEKALNFYNDIKMYAFTNTIDPNNPYRDAEFMVTGTDAAALLDNKDFEGRMPQTVDEVIIDNSSGKFEIGDTIILSTRYYHYQDFDENTIVDEFVITGITDKVHGSNANGGYVFFSDAFLNSDLVDPTYIDQDRYSDIEYQYQESYMKYLDKEIFVYEMWVIDVMGSGTPSILFTDDETFNGDFDALADGVTQDIDVSANVWIWDESNFSEQILHEDYQIEEVTIYDEANGNYDIIFINQSLYQLFQSSFEEAYKYVYTLTARDAASLSVDGLAAGNRVLDRIDTDVYRVYYPSNVPTPTNFLYVFYKYFYNILLVLFGLFLYLIVHAVTKNTMRSRSKDFAIYRSIGAQQTSIARLVVIEQVMIALGSIIFMLITINILGIYVAQIGANLRVLTLSNYLYLFVIFILFGMWLGLRFNKRVFKQSVIENINLSKEVA